MISRLILVVLASVTLAGCGLGCATDANTRGSSGACGGHVTFLH